MHDTTSQSLSEDLRRVANKLRSSSMPLSDLIPMLQRAADALDKRRDMDAKAEPMGHVLHSGHGDHYKRGPQRPSDLMHAGRYVWTPVYAHPPAAQDREPMTDEDAWEIAMRKCGLLHSDVLHMSRKQVVALAREVERFHNIKEPQR